MAFVLVGLAGCMDPSPAAREPVSPADDATVPSQIVWTDCKRLGMRIDGPGGFFDVHTPPGWEPGFQPGSSISVGIYECARIAWGPYVRGPVFMLQELHGEFDNPQSCSTNPNVLVRSIVESFWFSDPELVTYAKDVYGMTAYHAEFTQTRSDFGGGLMAATWTWAEPGGPVSEATFYDPPVNDNRTQVDVLRLFWFNGVGISWMDFSESFEYDLGTRTAEGTMHPPTLYGRSMANPSFVAPNASLTANHQITGTIARFGDMACLEPL